MLYSIRKFTAAGIVAAAVSLAASLPAHADVTFTLGNHPSGDVNILLNSGLTGPLVTGTTNTTPGINVDFSSATDTLTEPASGQARVGASDGAVNDITISIPGGYYTDLIINPFVGSAGGGAANVSVVANDGTFNFGYPGSGLGNGNNFLTIVATGGETISSTTIDSTGGFDDLRQPRISGAALNSTPVTPEPGTLALLSTGVLPLFGGLRRRFRRA